ncbi:MAG: antibiotic biosynthesis monooxygenase [Micrococcales bacterium]|nr:antibiotic biosynthesis monooxygenase [Micrococcales bacterium]
MIFVVVKFQVKPESVPVWLDVAKPFTRATRAEEGNLWFDWYSSAERPDEFVLVEAFKDSAAGADHVGSPHFRSGLDALKPHLVGTPLIVSQSVDQEGWNKMAELAID